MKALFKSISRAVLCGIVCVSVIINMPCATHAEQQPVTVIACSDFQNPDGREAGSSEVAAILNSAKSSPNGDISRIDGFICCGDYDHNMSSNQAETVIGINALRDTVRNAFGTGFQEIFVKGNHDIAGTVGIAQSGENDAKSGKYGVFVINESDYMWKNTKPDVIKQTAENLKQYLDEKIENKYSAPVFIVSHLPLHFTYRTKYEFDAMYAEYLFDVINEAGEKGLNIIYLYGHDHSNGWDDYLGGAAVYLKKGDSINIADAPQPFYNVKTLNFTYMNAGFTGYYSSSSTGVDSSLTMTAFNIYPDRVEISRFDKDGIHNLKSGGVHNQGKGETDSDYPCDTAVYESPQTVKLNIFEPLPSSSEEAASAESAQSSEDPVSDAADSSDTASADIQTDGEAKSNITVILISAAAVLVLICGAVAVTAVIKKRNPKQ